MAAYDNSPYIKKDKDIPAPEGFEGYGAGSCGTMGRANDGENHRQAPDPKGTFGPDVSDGLVSGAAQDLIARSTGIKTTSHANPPLYGKKGTY